MKILFLIRKYKVTDGASTAVFRHIEQCCDLHCCKVVTRFCISHEQGIDVEEVNSYKEIRKILSEGEYDMVYYYKTSGYDIFDWTVKAIRSLKRDIPVVTVVCQRPSYPGLWLSPSEINNSNRIVFIDKTSYADPLYSFLPKKKKSQVYLGCSDQIIEKTGRLLAARNDEDHAGTVVYGRGSTLSKCPSHMIDIFNKIDVKGKKFIIAGVEKNSWAGKEAEGREDIEIVPPTSFDEWLETCSRFDIFLYHLPLSSHASIDGTLGNAMLLENAVVYLGPSAPAERFIHGENALVAKNEEELVKYATMLGNDPALRKRLGQEARRTTIRDFSYAAAIQKFKNIESEVKDERKPKHVSIPLSYKLKFLKVCRANIIKSLLGGTWIERRHFATKPPQ